MLCTLQGGKEGLNELCLNGKSILDEFCICGGRFYMHGAIFCGEVSRLPLVCSER